MTEGEHFAVWFEQAWWREWWPWIVLAVGIAIVAVGGVLFSPVSP